MENRGRREKYMRSLFLSVFFVAAFSAVGIAADVEEQGSRNLIQKEMIALDSAFKVTVDAIVLNEPGRILPAFEETNELRVQVERAVKGGTKIVLPKNQKRFREFVRLDNKFHRDLELLLKAAGKKNVAAVQRQTHRLLDACVRCHRIFRK
jgi:cytochrome c556